MTAQDVARSVGGLLIMIGAEPCTGWLKDAVLLGDRGFVRTEEDGGPGASVPFDVFQTNLPGGSQWVSGQAR